MARLYGYGSLSDEEQKQLQEALAPVLLESTSSVPPAADTRTNPSYVVSADLFKTQRMHIGNFPQRESQITLSIVDIQTKALDNATMIHIGGIVTFDANSINLVGMDFALQFNVNSKTSCTVEFLKIGDATAANIIGSGTLAEVSMIQIHDPTTLGANITTTVGLDIQDINSALTNNIAIRTGLGLVQFGEDVTIAGTLGVTGAITGITAEEVGAGTFPSGTFVFQGALSGITTLDATGNITTSDSFISTGGGETGKFFTGSAGATVFAFSGANFDIRAGTGTSASQNVIRVTSAGVAEFKGPINVDNPDEWLLLTDTLSSGSVDLTFQNGTTGTGAAGFQIGITTTEQAMLLNYENTDMLFSTNNAERVRITGAGQVIIGTSAAPSADSQLIIHNATAPTFAFSSPNRALINGSLIGLIEFWADDDSSGEALELASIIQNIGTGTWDSSSALHQVQIMLKASADVAPVSVLICNQDGRVIVPNLTASSDVQTGAAKELVSVSDERLKIGKRPLVQTVLPLLMEIVPTYFRWKYAPEGGEQLGFLAQNVAPRFPQAAPKSIARVPDGDIGPEMELYGFNSRAMLAVVVKGMQELNQRLALLEEAA